MEDVLVGIVYKSAMYRNFHIYVVLSQQFESSQDIIYATWEVTQNQVDLTKNVRIYYFSMAPIWNQIKLASESVKVDEDFWVE